MLPELYRIHLSSQLTQAQLLTLEILVWLLQVHKEVKIERLAAHFPLPIKYENRRRHIQRLLLISPAMSVTLIWLYLIEDIIKLKFKQGERLYLAIDRTSVEGNSKGCKLTLYWIHWTNQAFNFNCDLFYS